MVQIPVQTSRSSFFIGNKLPVLVYAGQIDDEPNWTFPSHKHDDLSEIIYIARGQGHFVIDNHPYTAKAGDILVYNQGVLHEEKSDPGNPLKTYFCAVTNLHIDGIAKGRILPAEAVPVIQAEKYSGKIESYISGIFEEVSSQVLGFEAICQNLLASLIVLIHRIVRTLDKTVKPGETESLGYQIKSYLDKNYTDDLSLHEIANRLYISPYYLAHIFKQEIGYSPIRYIIQRRIAEAQKLLLTSDLSVQEISRAVGYDNSNYFSFLFKKATGESPVTFRKKNLRR